MSLRLNYEDSVSVFFYDEYRWLDSARFSIVGDVTSVRPNDVLNQLLTDDHYVNAYQYADCVAAEVHTRQGHRETYHDSYLRHLLNDGQTPDADPMREGNPALWHRYNSPGPEHGPYLMSRISIDTFDAIDGAAARASLISWLDDDREAPRAAPTAITGDLKKITDQLESAPIVYRLCDLGEDAHHASGFVVDDPYLELVTVDLRAGRLHLIAGGGD